VLALRLAKADNITNRINISNIHNGSTMTSGAGSRPAAGWEGEKSRRERSDRGSAEGGSKSVDSTA